MKKITFLFAVLFTAQLINGQCIVDDPTTITVSENTSQTLTLPDIDFTQTNALTRIFTKDDVNGSTQNDTDFNYWNVTYNTLNVGGSYKLDSLAGEQKKFIEVNLTNAKNFGDLTFKSTVCDTIENKSASAINILFKVELEFNQPSGTKAKFRPKFNFAGSLVSRNEAKNGDGNWIKYSYSDWAPISLAAGEKYSPTFELGLGKAVVNNTLKIKNIVLSFTASSGVTLNNSQFSSGAFVSLYPNPVSDVLNVQTSENIAAIAVSNIMGQELIQTETGKQVDVSSLSSGVYLVQVTNTSGETVSSKFVKR